MYICLSRKGCQNNNVSIAEVLLLLAIHNNANLNEAQESLINKGYITASRNNLFQPDGWRITRKGAEVIDAVIIDSDKHQEPEDRLTNLAKNLKEIFPKGKKAGTNYYWAEGIALIIRRLKLFFKKYGNTYTDEQIIQAAYKYVEGFNGNYTYMKLLKYFIFKEKTNVSGEIEGESELINYIENAGQEDSLSSDWTSTLR
jgi:hypothetical protein